MLYINKRFESKILKSVLFILFMVLFCQLSWINTAYAESEEVKIIDEQVKSDEVSSISEQIKKHSNQAAKDIIPGYDPQKIISDTAKGDFKFSLTGILNGALRYLLKEIYLNIDILIKLIILVVLCAILKNLQTSFLSESVGELAFYTCYIVIVSVLIVSFNTALKLGIEIIDSMVSFMHATIPVLITLLLSGGNVTSAGIFQPILIMIVEVSATIIKNVFLPLIFLSTVLTIMDNISDKVQISKLAGFLKQISGWGLGLILTIFIAIVSLHGSLGAVVDGVTSKTTKFAIGAFIPVAGKYLADAADAVLGCTLLIKNAAGVGVMVGIISICLAPILKLLALVTLYRLTCVIIEPISEKRITSCINDMANSLTFVLGIVASIVFMFLISVTVIISASNISAMVR
ncbi:MAG: stage III sporulation protein AE [Clostridia bacterium]|nr:stage III sporulation protein AE [Clostridia bacterium]